MAELERVIPRNILRSLGLAFPLRWNVARTYRLPQGRLGPYYIDWSSGSGLFGEDWDRAPFDDRGVILTPRGGRYHPVRIAQFGLHMHARWKVAGSNAGRRAFAAQAQWLAANQTNRSGIAGSYRYDFPNTRYGAPKGWISAMAQGEAISLLLRAADAFEDDRFAQAAKTAAEPFRHDVRDGGVVYHNREGDTFLEEVAELPASHILNGHIFALWGVMELAQQTGESWLDELATQATITLRRRLPLYDSGYWSYYHLLMTRRGFRNVAVLKYHAFHVAQLRVMAFLTGDLDFSATADRWEGYVRSGGCRARMIANTLTGLVPRFLTRTDTVAGGAVSLV